jgi:hypothetical protein
MNTLAAAEPMCDECALKGENSGKQSDKEIFLHAVEDFCEKAARARILIIKTQYRIKITLFLSRAPLMALMI